MTQSIPFLFFDCDKMQLSLQKSDRATHRRKDCARSLSSAPLSHKHHSVWGELLVGIMQRVILQLFFRLTCCTISGIEYQAENWSGKIMQMQWHMLSAINRKTNLPNKKTTINHVCLPLLQSQLWLRFSHTQLTDFNSVQSTWPWDGVIIYKRELVKCQRVDKKL